MNFALVAAGYAKGNVLFDPALPITDARADVWSTTLGLVRSVSWFGLSGRIGAIVPTAAGKWSGDLGGIDTSTTRAGLADPRVLLAVNFIGAPALSLSEMRGYRRSTVAGLQLQVSLPLGQYDPDKLINLGSHRWAVSPRLGISQALGRRWFLEGYGGFTWFSTNTDFYGGTVFEQDPFFTTEADVVYSIRVPDIWVAISIGHGWGGAGTVNQVQRESLDNTRASAVLRLPLGRAPTVSSSST
jgi:Putative MetA-pathway of phenol degradation